MAAYIYVGLLIWAPLWIAFCWWMTRDPAQAMSARQGQDPQGLGAKPASAVGETDAPDPSSMENSRDD